MGRKYQFEIKLLTTNKEFEECMEIQKAAWFLEDYKDCIPSHVKRAILETGGAIVGAVHRKKIVAYAMSLPAVSKEEDFYHHSHIMGVLPRYQGKGIGYMMKMKQREYALKNNAKKITWTFDPLLAQNASLNIRKLGGIVKKYNVDFYGTFMGGSGIVSGIPSDRFYLEWYVSSKQVKAKLKSRKKDSNRKIEEIEKNEAVNKIEIDKKGIQKISDVKLGLSVDSIIIEIPENFQNIYNKSLKKANEWRLKTRNIFNYYLGKGYTVTDFYTRRNTGNIRNYYLLQKNYKPEF